MFAITLKHYFGEYEGDERYEIIQTRCDDNQVSIYVESPKGWNYEVLSISRIF